MTDENLGEMYVKVGMDLAALEKDVRAMKAKLDKELPKPKVDYDTVLGKKKISELLILQEKLKAKLEEKIKLDADLSSINRTRDVLSSVNHQLVGIQENTEKVGFDFKNFIGLAGGIITITSALALLKNSIGKSAEMESYSTSLKVMLGDADKAKERLQELVDFAASTPYEIPEVVGLGNQLQAVGRYSKETLTNLGDLASAAGKPLDQVAGAFAKLASGQKGIAVDMFRDLLITTDDWVKATGKGVTKTGEMIASTEEMLAAIPKILDAKKFNGMMEEQSKTLKGQLSNLSDAAGQVKTAFGDTMAPFIKSVVSGAIPALQGLKGNLDLVIGTVKVGGITFIAYEAIINGVVIKKKLMAFWTDVLIAKSNALKVAIASNPLGALAVALVAVGAAAYELNEKFGNTIENQIKWNEEAQKLNKTEQQKTSTLIEAKKKAGEVATSYENLYRSYQKTKEGTKEHDEAEKKLHSILEEQQKLYPGLITNTFDYAGNIDKMKEASRQAVIDVSTLTGELTKQQRALLDLKLAKDDIELDTASKNLRDVSGVFSLSRDNKTFQNIDKDLRTGKRSLTEVKKEVEELSSKYAAWAAQGGESMQYNIDKATALNTLLAAINTKINDNNLKLSGKGIDGSKDSDKGSGKKPTGVDDTKDRKKELDARLKFYEDVIGYTEEYYKTLQQLKEIDYKEAEKAFGKDKVAFARWKENYEKELAEKIALRKKEQEVLDNPSSIKIKPKEIETKKLKDYAPKELYNDTDKKKDFKIDITELDTAKKGAESFAQTISSGFTQAIMSSENLGQMFKNVTLQLAGMVLQALAFKGIMSALDVSSGGLFGGLFTLLGAHDGGSFIGTSTGVKKMAAGGSFIVPAGYSNDSFPLLVQSGERVQVTPSNRVGDSEKLLGSLINRMDLINYQLIENSTKETKGSLSVAVNGELQGRDIYLSNKRTGKRQARMT